MTFKQRVKQQGIGLLELMLALAIIAILIVMATRYFGMASKSQKLTATSSQIAELNQALYQWRNSNHSSDIPDITALHNAGLITDQLATGITPVGEIKITSTTASPPYTATITTTDPSGDTCKDIKVPEGVTGVCASNVLTLTFP